MTPKYIQDFRPAYFCVYETPKGTRVVRAGFMSLGEAVQHFSGLSEMRRMSVHLENTNGDVIDEVSHLGPEKGFAHAERIMSPKHRESEIRWGMEIMYTGKKKESDEK